MDLRCPYCQFNMTAARPRPGRFTPRCSQCQEKFALTISDDPAAGPHIRPLPTPTAAAAPAAFVAAETQPPPGVARTAPPAPPAPSVPARATADVTAVPTTATAPPKAPLAFTAIQPAHSPDDESGSLGGYQISRKLGQGGMGAVYLARQLSLDRDVALKVLNPTLAEDPGFVSRFTREAYAAAQLVHHNVVQVYDIGEDDGRHFYSMEFVEGESLANLVARDGRVDPSAAVAYTLQAARGLKFAHDRGLIHRDVKPDNLLLNAQGVVKVADLGLVKRNGVADVVGGTGGKLARAQSAEVTGFDLSMGTPAYMAPEQARDAARVDQRADIYSLGCTLYDLLVGRPPFSGKTAVEVMTKHASEPITPPDVLSKRVPKEVSALLMRMVAKRPDDRYPNAAACIMAMEDFLGAGSSGPFAPREEHAAELEATVHAFRNGPLARAARYGVPGFFGLILLLAVFAALLGNTLASRTAWAAAFLAVAGFTAAAYVVVSGITRRDVVLGKLRPMVFESRPADWLRVLLTVGVLGLVLYVFNLAAVAAGLLVVGFGLAAAYHFGLQWPRDRQRTPHVRTIEEMLRSMRLRGLDEETLRQFVCRYSGKDWEEFYEALFGYDAKLDARRRWGLSLRGKARPRFGLWREALVAWAERRVAARHAARARRLLAAVEEAKLEADGVDLLTARKTARREAAAMVRVAEAQRRQTAAASEAYARAARTAAPTRAPAVAAPRVPLDLDPVERDHESAFTRKGGVKQLLFGAGTRFPIALGLLAVFLLWFHQNNPHFPDNFGHDARAAIDGTIAGLQHNRDALAKDARAPVKVTAASASDLRFAVLPQWVRHQLSGYGVGLAGVLLLATCLLPHWKAGLLAVAGAAVVVIGDLAIPSLGGVSAPLLAGAAGTALFALSVAFGRE